MLVAQVVSRNPRCVIEGPAPYMGGAHATVHTLRIADFCPGDLVTDISKGMRVMIDARTHVVALSQQIDMLAAAPVHPRLAAARDQLVGDCAEHRAYARLGALLDHVLHHAASDGSELELLKEASKMWTEGLGLYTEVGRIRSEIESALVDPSNPGSASRFCDATLSFRQLMDHAKDTFTEMDSLGKRLRKMSHIPRHPRQEDEPLSEWGWGTSSSPAEPMRSPAPRSARRARRRPGPWPSESSPAMRRTPTDRRISHRLSADLAVPTGSGTA